MNTYFTKVMNRQDGISAAIGDIDLKNYLAIIFQLGIVALLLRQLHIESAAFLRLAILVFGGFAHTAIAFALNP
ncbi:hypothetical protein [Candidatus Methylobacter favarea]|uniref:hypothetical protein n=1 Tax=Candidatus Methylobacter favarea TaxID=2707345 RepID=UPI00157C2EF7|nr:hypothetical protein [Candidatus Methylobacter favarea]